MRMVHPGPRAPDRIVTRRADLRPIAGVLPKGAVLMDAVGDLFAAHGCTGGVLSLAGVVCDPMRFVLPAPSTDGVHAAWYSDTHSPDGAWRIHSATATVGIKEGAPFLHCHGVWGDAPQMGHILPFDCILAEDAAVSGLGAAETWFEVLPDAETAFSLFTPQGGGTGRGVFARILPGEDVITAVEAVAAAHKIANARLHAVGSIDHITFVEGHGVACHATELRFDGAALTTGRAHIPIEVVDINGTISRGILTRGNNPVGVTLELIIEPTEDRI